MWLNHDHVTPLPPNPPHTEFTGGGATIRPRHPGRCYRCLSRRRGQVLEGAQVAAEVPAAARCNRDQVSSSIQGNAAVRCRQPAQAATASREGRGAGAAWGPASYRARGRTQWGCYCQEGRACCTKGDGGAEREAPFGHEGHHRLQRWGSGRAAAGAGGER